MASKKVNIDISTTANTAGAKQASTSIDKLDASNEKATASANENASAAIKASTAIDELDASNVKAAKSTNDTAAAAENASASLDGLASSSTKAAGASDTAATASSKVASGAKNAGQVAQAAGYQIQDFATQVSAGTSAFTAFAQNAPQFLGVFGPKGAVAGALLAVGAIAAKVFLDMGDNSKSAAEKAEELAEAFDKIGENAAKSIREDADFGKAKIEQAKNKAKNLAEEINNAAENQIDFNETILESFSNVLKAEGELRKLRGESSNALQSVAAQEKAAADARAVDVQIALDRENLKLKAKEDQVAIDEAALQKAKQQKAEAEELLQQERLNLQALRDQLAELKKQSTERATLAEQIKRTVTDPIGTLGVNMEDVESRMTSPAAVSAKEQLKTGNFEGRISVIEKAVNQLMELTDRTGDLTTQVNQSITDLENSQSQLRQTNDDVKTKVNEIIEVAQDKEVIAKVQTAKETAEAFATEVKQMIEGVKPTNDQQKAALADLGKYLENNQITQDEIAKTSAALVTLSPVINQSVQKNTMNINQLIQVMNSFSISQDRLQGEINNIKAQMPTPYGFR